MKTILVLALFALWLPILYAADIERTIDPDDAPTYVIQCDPPETRTDGTPIDVSEIQTYEFHRSTDGTTYVQQGLGELSCSYPEDVGSLPDGTYYYRASATDTDDQTSVLSVDRLVLILRRIPAHPNSPANLR